MRPGESRGNHTAACRRRFEQLLSETEAGRQRLRGRDVRHRLAPEDGEPERQEQAEAGVSERGRSSVDPGEDQERGDGVHEPRGIARARAPEQQERATRRRVKEPRGQRRQREDLAHSDDEEPPETSRRLGAVRKLIADVVDIKSRYSKSRGLDPQEQCTRDVAKSIINDLDQKHAGSSRGLRRRLRTLDTSDLVSLESWRRPTHHRA